MLAKTQRNIQALMPDSPFARRGDLPQESLFGRRGDLPQERLFGSRGSLPQERIFGRWGDLAQNLAPNKRLKRKDNWQLTDLAHFSSSKTP